MTKRGLLQCYETPNYAIQGKNKNRVWYDPNGKLFSLFVPEFYEYKWTDAAGRSITMERIAELSQSACSRALWRPQLPGELDKGADDFAQEARKFGSTFSVHPKLQTVINPDLDAEESELHVGRLIPFSGDTVSFPLGEGVLNFLYADFDTPAAAVCKNCEEDHEAVDTPIATDAERQLFDSFLLSESVLRFRPLIHASVYSMAFPPFLRMRTKKELSEYVAYLKALQKKLADLIEFVFDPDYYPEVLGDIRTDHRYAFYCKLMNHPLSAEYTYLFEFPADNVNPLSQHINFYDIMEPPKEPDSQMGEFCKKYCATEFDVRLYRNYPVYPITHFRCQSIDDMLMFEFWQMLASGVSLRKCKRCGKYFIMKGNYDTNYCDRIAPGETRNCQELAAQENYKKKMADDAAIPMYQKYYKRYAARVRVNQLKETDFKKWKYEATLKRDACSAGKLSLEEFESWLEGCFPNRKKR